MSGPQKAQPIDPYLLTEKRNPGPSADEVPGAFLQFQPDEREEYPTQDTDAPLIVKPSGFSIKLTSFAGLVRND